MMQNQIIEKINKFDFSIKPINMNNSIELYCSPLLFEYLQQLIVINKDYDSTAAAILYNNFGDNDSQDFYMNHLFSIKSERGKIFLYLTSIVYVSDDEGISEEKELEDRYIEDLSMLGFKGMVYRKINNSWSCTINAELEYETKEEFVNLVKVATKEVLEDYSNVSELPNTFAVQIITSKQNFIITPHSGCYSLKTLKYYIANHIKY